MKKLTLVSLLAVGLIGNANAGDADWNPDDLWFPAEDPIYEKYSVASEPIQLAEATQVEQSVGSAADATVNQNTSKTFRLNMISRRPYMNRAVKDKAEYRAGDAWVGATRVEEQESEASKRLNRRFRSKRPHIKYQFD